MPLRGCFLLRITLILQDSMDRVDPERPVSLQNVRIGSKHIFRED